MNDDPYPLHSQQINPSTYSSLHLTLSRSLCLATSLPSICLVAVIFASHTQVKNERSSCYRWTIIRPSPHTQSSANRRLLRPAMCSVRSFRGKKRGDVSRDTDRHWSGSDVSRGQKCVDCSCYVTVAAPRECQPIVRRVLSSRTCRKTALAEHAVRGMSDPTGALLTKTALLGVILVLPCV